MSYKEIVLNYIKTHDIPYFLRTGIEDGLRKCKSDDDVYKLIYRINYRIVVHNCKLRGDGDHYIPKSYADEIVSDDILKVLDETKKKELAYESKISKEDNEVQVNS